MNYTQTERACYRELEDSMSGPDEDVFEEEEEFETCVWCGGSILDDEGRGICDTCHENSFEEEEGPDD